MRRLIKKAINRFNKWLYKPKTDIEMLAAHGVKYGENVNVYGCDYDLRYGPLLEIGDNVTISRSKILLHDASPRKFLDSEYGTKLRPVKIGSNVFIGYGCIVLPGTVVGDNVIAGAGTVLRGNIPSDSVIYGNPWQRLCSCKEYIEGHERRQKDAVIYKGKDYAEVIKWLEEGKSVYIE